MTSATSHVDCVPLAPGVYRLYRRGRPIGEAATVGDGTFHASHSFTGSQRVVASLPAAVRWFETIEEAVAASPAMV